jgi:hypothetical protein
MITAKMIVEQTKVGSPEEEQKRDEVYTKITNFYWNDVTAIVKLIASAKSEFSSWDEIAQLATQVASRHERTQSHWGAQQVLMHSEHSEEGIAASWQKSGDEFWRTLAVAAMSADIQEMLADGYISANLGKKKIQVEIKDVVVHTRTVEIDSRCPHCGADLCDGEAFHLDTWEYQDQQRPGRLVLEDDGKSGHVEDDENAMPEGGESFISCIGYSCGACGYPLIDGRSHEVVHAIDCDMGEDCRCDAGAKAAAAGVS